MLKKSTCGVMLRGPNRKDFDLFPFRQPLIADLGQQVDIQLVSKEQHGSRMQLF